MSPREICLLRMRVAFTFLRPLKEIPAGYLMGDGS